MLIKKATQQDLAAVDHLLSRYPNKMQGLGAEHFNHRDIALQARLNTGELVGFVWCGVMAKGKIGYVDYLVVSPEHSKMGIGKALDRALLLECRKRKIKRVFGVVQVDEYHDRMSVCHLKNAAKFHPIKHTVVYSNVEESLKALEGLGV